MPESYKNQDYSVTNKTPSNQWNFLKMERWPHRFPVTGGAQPSLVDLLLELIERK